VRLYSEIAAQVYDHGLLLDGFYLCDPALVGALKDCNTISRTDAQVFDAAGPRSSGLLLIFGELGLEECPLGRDGAPVVAVLGELADVAAGSNRPQVPILMASLDADVQIRGGFPTQPRHLPNSVPFFVGILFLGLPFGTACDLALGHAHPSEDLVHLSRWVLSTRTLVSIKKASSLQSQPTRSLNSQFQCFLVVRAFGNISRGWQPRHGSWQRLTRRKAASASTRPRNHRTLQCRLPVTVQCQLLWHSALFLGPSDRIQKQETSMIRNALVSCARSASSGRVVICHVIGRRRMRLTS